MIVPRAVVNQKEVLTVVAEVEQALKHDVVRIQSQIGTDWSGEYAIFFGVVLRNAAAKPSRLSAVTARVETILRQRLGDLGSNVLMYFSFRSESEEPQVTKDAWWV